MRKLPKAVSALLIFVLAISGCSPSAPNYEDALSSGIKIPTQPENSEHGYSVQETDIPSIESCTEWEDFWAFEGPAVSFSVAEETGDKDVAVSTQIYLENSDLDKNGDGIICYFENLNMSASPKSAISANTQLASAEKCKIKSTITGFEHSDSGFPRHPDYDLSADNEIVIQLVYVDANDLQHVGAPSQDAEFWIDGAGQFLSDVTYGQIQFEWRFENKYFRLPKSFTSFSLTRSKQGDPAKFLQSAISAADAEVDFTDVDIVIAITPPEITKELIDYSPAIPLTASTGFKTDEGKVYRGTFAGADTRWAEGYLLIAHEIGHLLGLEDYYSFNWKQGDSYEELFKFMGEFDNMNFAPGKAREWTGWSRWLLGAIKDDQVRCVTNLAESTHQLWAISSDESQPKIVVVPTGASSAIVVESRKSRRHDKQLPRANEGLLVYEVDTARKSGYGPLRIVRKANLYDSLLIDAPLRPGESVTVKGITIENIEAGALWDVARITEK